MKHHCLLTSPDETASHKISLERPTNSEFEILGVRNRSVFIMRSKSVSPCSSSSMLLADDERLISMDDA
jgi:hypothetical protein